MASLAVPDLSPDDDCLTAALAYARSGWFILPIKPDRTPALGKDWPTKTSNDPEQIVAWYAGTDLQVGLHVGRSGAIVFDVDNPAALPPALADHLTDAVPHQSTREAVPGRGHWVFRQPEGRYLGNSRGDLGSEWGEVRGANGMIVVQPSRHIRTGGRYLWVRTGDVPALPESLSAALPDFTGRAAVASNAAVKAFLQSREATRPMNLRAITQKFNEEAVKGARHEALVSALAWAMREAAMGFFTPKAAIDALWPDWCRVIGSESGRFPRDEFAAAQAWAVGAALGDAEKLAARRKDIAERMAETAYLPESTVRTEAAVGSVAPDDAAVATANPREPGDYFGSTGLNVALLAEDVLSLGEVSWGADGRFWSYSTEGVWRPDKDVVEQRVVRLLAGRFRLAHATNAQVVVKHRVGRIDAGPVERYVNFRNGMLDWRTGELVPHAPHFGSTVQLPIDWEPEAPCAKFEAFLSSVLEDDYVVLAWEMIGYLMMSGNPLQKAFLLLGTGGNGKGTLIRVIEELLGRNNVSTQSLNALSSNRFAPVDLFGKIANLAGDIDSTYQETTAQFKMLTGEDPLPGEYKYGSSFTFTNWAVPVFSANRIPGSADTSQGYLRRWQVIEFNRTFTAAEAIPGLSGLLADELPGIAARGIASLQTLMRRNGGRGGFHTSEVIGQGAARLAESIDQVRVWIGSGQVLIAPGGEETQSAVFRAYRNWAVDNHYGVLRSGEFIERLAAIDGIKIVKVRGARMVRGLTILDLRTPDQQFSDVIGEST